ncbi:MAG: hypothetical protein K8L99_25765 [Anaerolineae bacterium]|nr:hypothetical protein [Anaerolineae bacterium]
MSVAILWDDEIKTAVRFTITQPWTVDDLDVAMEQLFLWIEERDYPIHLIYDVRQSGFPPPGILRHLSNYMGHCENPGKIIFVGNHKMMRDFLNILIRIYSTTCNESSYLFADTLEEAREKLITGLSSCKV